jgi:uncharacterized protein (TIGR02996 family)
MAHLRRAWLSVERGERIPLQGKMLIGRAKHCDVVVDSARIGREQATIEVIGERVLYTDLGANQGTLLVRGGVQWGKVTKLTLEDGDTLRAYPRLDFFHERPPEDYARAALERALVEAPEDASRWAVYADRLLELGDPLAQRIISRSEEWQSWAWPLGEALEVGALTWEFAHGHVRAATLREPSQGWRSRGWPQSELLRVLCHAREARFMTELRIELVPSGMLGIHHLREAFALCRLPALKRFTVTPSPRDTWLNAAGKAFEV